MGHRGLLKLQTLYLVKTSGRPFALPQLHDGPSAGFIVSIAVGEYDLDFQLHYIFMSKEMTLSAQKTDNC
jgi:hypothetical protein